MSVAEFSAAIRSTAFRDFFQRLSTSSILKSGVSDLRKEEQVAEKTAFYITDKTIADVVKQISGSDATEEQISSILNNLRNVKYANKRRAVEKEPPFTDGKTLYFPRVSFDTINRILEEGFKDILKEARISKPKVAISDYFDRGHVYGIFPKKVAEAKESLARNATLAPKHKEMLVGILNDLYKELEMQDEATSNLKTDSYTLYSKYKKSKNKYLVELQLIAGNQESGRAQAPLSTALRKFFNPGKLPVSGSGLKFTSGPGEQLLAKLIESKGSPSMVDLITYAVMDAIDKGKRAVKTYSTDLIKIVENKGSKVNTSKLNRKIKEEKLSTKKLINSIKRIPSTTTESAKSSIDLQAILAARINQQVAENMGKGDEHRILNYRTGRFAESVSIDRISESRQGMISVFYNYMKNPYATFSDGGRQQYPKTRDPKLLISKSIREIAMPIVGNRLRSVVV
jgi:hypothetical protein